jgi:hypothetical protein
MICLTLQSFAVDDLSHPYTDFKSASTFSFYRVFIFNIYSVDVAKILIFYNFYKVIHVDIWT